jgi:4-carboxymuconolactone decarboxylase
MQMAETPPSAGREALRAFMPGLIELTDEVLFGDVWKREDLAPRDRSLVTVTALVALGRTEQLPNHLRRALDNGVTVEELKGAITHLAFYSGWPTAMSAGLVLKEVVEERAAR